MRVLFTCLVALSVLAFSPWAAAMHGDIVFKRKGNVGKGYPPATFPHAVHRYQFKCYVCHDAIFHMKAGADDVTMEKIVKGKYCGVCHNGKIAFSVTFASCQRCHR